MISNLERLPGETDFQYHKRLILGKLENRTLSDVDYTELSDLVYGKEYSSDVARRMMYGSKFTINLLEENNIHKINEDEILKDINRQKEELAKERQRFMDQRREYNKRVAFEGREEHLYDIIADAAYRLHETTGNVFKDERYSDIVSDNEAILVFSDWHYGMVADNVYNKFNTDICKERIETVVAKAIKRMTAHQCKHLHVVVLGDLFHGGIHVSTRVASEELICDQLMQSSEILAQAIIKLSQYVPETTVCTTYGNHARSVSNKDDSIHRDNMERIVRWWLEQRLSDYPDIVVAEESNNEFCYLDVCGHGFCASHGDIDKVTTSPRLLYTLFKKQYGVDIEYVIIGDKHHSESFNELGITAKICGSLCGVDEYANVKRLYAKPSQLLWIVNEESGVDAEYELRC